MNDGGRTDLPEWAKKAEVTGNLVKPAPLTAQEQRQVLDILLTADPIAIVEAGHVLGVGRERQVLKVGNSAPNGDPGPYGDWEFMLAAASSASNADAAMGSGHCSPPAARHRSLTRRVWY